METVVRLRATDVTVVSERADTGRPAVVAGASFALPAGGAVGIAGESGCGKTSLVHSLFGYARRGLRIEHGHTVLTGCGEHDGGSLELALTRPDACRGVAGRFITVVPQSANSICDPVMRIGDQLDEVAQVTMAALKTDRQAHVRGLLEEVGFDNVDHVRRQYPHQLSGGQRQRVAICMALIAEPKVLVFDEATTDLDAVTQDRILGLVQRLQAIHDFSLVVVSHDLRVLSRLCRDVLIMYGGQIVESGPLESVFARPAHPYTAMLLTRYALGPTATAAGDERAARQTRRGSECAYLARCPLARERCVEGPELLPSGPGRYSRCWAHQEVPPISRSRTSADPARDPAATHGSSAGREAERPTLLEVKRLTASYRGSGLLSRRVGVLRDIDLRVGVGETVGIVGESGSGKSTLGKILVGLHTADSGCVTYEGVRLDRLPARRRPLQLRRDIQIIFQNPEGALNPVHSVGEILGRQIRRLEETASQGVSARIAEVLETVGLPPEHASRLPDELSGGEKQRVAIARALIGGPRLIVCDEIVSSLDVVGQARIIQLLKRIQAQTGVAYIFISHDLPVVADVADTVAVFRLGEICETGHPGEVLRRPRHQYTRQLAVSSMLTVGSENRFVDVDEEGRDHAERIH